VSSFGLSKMDNLQQFLGRGSSYSSRRRRIKACVTQRINNSYDNASAALRVDIGLQDQSPYGGPSWTGPIDAAVLSIEGLHTVRTPSSGATEVESVKPPIIIDDTSKPPIDFSDNESDYLHSFPAMTTMLNRTQLSRTKQTCIQSCGAGQTLTI